MDTATLERLGTAGILAIVLLGIMFYRERQHTQERKDAREDVARMAGMIEALHGDIRGVLENLVTSQVKATEGLKAWLEGKFK